MTQYAMVIDLRKCVGCGSCAIACKTENNTAMRKNGQTHNYADFIHETTGKFPNTKHRTLPVLCNHCSEAPCVEVCPEDPKAMYKTKDGITMRNEKRCIGCRECQMACPYSQEEVQGDGATGQYSVISYTGDEGEPYHAMYADNTVLIVGGTMSGKELVAAAKADPPDQTRYSHPDYKDARRSEIIEKCFFCDHRLKKGQQPYCVDSCPANARTVGDISDPGSAVSKLLKKNKSFVLKPEEGTKPNVYYINSYSV